MGTEYVDVMFVQNWDEIENEGDAPEWGDWQAMAEYLTQWDYGTITDDDRTRVDDSGRRGSGTDDAIVATVNDGDIEYRLTVNYGLRYASLTREPLETARTITLTDTDEQRLRADLAELNAIVEYHTDDMRETLLSIARTIEKMIN